MEFHVMNRTSVSLSCSESFVPLIFVSVFVSIHVSGHHKCNGVLLMQSDNEVYDISLKWHLERWLRLWGVFTSKPYVNLGRWCWFAVLASGPKYSQESWLWKETQMRLGFGVVTQSHYYGQKRLPAKKFASDKRMALASFQGINWGPIKETHKNTRSSSQGNWKPKQNT